MQSIYNKELGKYVIFNGQMLRIFRLTMQTLRGPVKRREGEKRRVKIGNRRGQQRQRSPEVPDKDAIRINLEDLGEKLEDFLTKPINS